MRDIDDMLPFVLPFAPNCADLTAYRCIREAAREVCEKVDIWREKDTISVTDIDGECLSTFGDAEVKKIEAAALDGIRLEPKSPEWLDANQPGWDGDNENQAQARFITQITPGKIVVVPRMTGTLSVRLILKPSLKAMTLPDFIVDKYATEIGRGAAGRVLMLPNDDGGANPAMATALLSEFNLFLDRLPMMAAKGPAGRAPENESELLLMPASTYAANAILNQFLRGVAAAPPTRLYVSLHTADPGNTGTSEVATAAWPAYTRLDAALGGAVASGFTAAAGKACTNAKELLYPPHNGAAPITVTHFAIWTDPLAGEMVMQGELIAPKTLNPTDECIIHANDLDIVVV